MSVFPLSGQVRFDNFPAVRSEGEARIDQFESVDFDLAALTNASSAVVALLIAWFRYAHARGKVVRFLEVPVPVMNIIDVSELGDVLPVFSGEATEGVEQVAALDGTGSDAEDPT